jgi:multiple sugar transport system ATP-binding protein
MNLVPASRTALDAVECLGTRFPLVAHGDLLESGSDVILGIRPEDLRWARGDADEGQVALRAQVEVVEPLGSETLVTVAIGEHRLIARFPPRTGISPGENVDLAFDPAHVHLFDPGSGASVLRHEP